jgi:hypothetical protein
VSTGGALPLKRRGFSVKSATRSVADMMTSLSGGMGGEARDCISRRSLTAPLRSPRSTSVLSERSCASSMMTTAYLRRRRSDRTSCRRMPSVMNFTAVVPERRPADS